MRHFSTQGLMSLLGLDWPAREGIGIFLLPLRYFACVPNLLVLVLALVLPVALSANEAVTEKVDPDRAEPSQEQKEEARQEIATEIAEGTQTAVSLESLLLRRLRVGNQTVSQNLSAMTSSLSHLFMEEPLPVSAFSLSRRLAVGYDHDWRRFGVHSMLFTRDPNNDAGKYGWALRVFTKPIRGSDKIVW